MISIQATDTTITQLTSSVGGSNNTCMLPTSGGALLVNTIKDIIVTIPFITYSYNALISDINAYTNLRVNAFANGLTTGGILGGDELEMTPLDVSAYCITDGVINIVISSTQGPIQGSYGISYTVQ